MCSNHLLSLKNINFEIYSVKNCEKEEKKIKVGILGLQNMPLNNNSWLYTNHTNLTLKISNLIFPTLDSSEFMLANPV